MNKIFRGKKNKAIAFICVAALLVASAALLVAPVLALPGDITDQFSSPYPPYDPDTLEGYVNLQINIPRLSKGLGTYRWVTTNPSVITVEYSSDTPSNCYITGIAPGAGTVVNSTLGGGINYQNFVVVENDNISAYLITGGSSGGYIAEEGGTYQINIQVKIGSEPEYADWESPTSGAISWISLDTDVATVDNTGLITATTGIGSTIIQGTFIDPWGTRRTIGFYVTVGVSGDDLIQDLADKLTEAKNRLKDGKKYSKESIEELEEAIDQGQDILDNYPDVSKDDIKNAIYRLIRAIERLQEVDVVKVGDKYYYELRYPRNVWVECTEDGLLIDDGNIIYTPYGDFPPVGDEGDTWFDKDHGHVRYVRTPTGQFDEAGYWYTPDDGAHWYLIGARVRPAESFTSVPKWEDFSMMVGDETDPFIFTTDPNPSSSILRIAYVTDIDSISIRGEKHNIIRALTPGVTEIKVVDQYGYQIGNTIKVTVEASPSEGVDIEMPPGGSLTLNRGESYKFRASVQPPTAVQTIEWSIDSTLSTISSDGNLVVGADETATVITVTAKSAADPTKSSTFDVNVRQIDTITITPAAPVSIARGANRSFTAQITPTEIPQTVTWELVGTSSATTITVTGGACNVSVGAGETAASITLRATSTYDTTKYTDVMINIDAGSILVHTGPHTPINGDEWSENFWGKLTGNYYRYMNNGYGWKVDLADSRAKGMEDHAYPSWKLSEILLDASVSINQLQVVPVGTTTAYAGKFFIQAGLDGETRIFFKHSPTQLEANATIDGVGSTSGAAVEIALTVKLTAPGPTGTIESATITLIAPYDGSQVYSP